MLHWWGGMLRIMSSSFPSPYSSLPSLWYKLILVSSVHRMLFQNCEGFFRCRLANSNLAFLFWGSPWFTSCGEPSVFTLVKSSLDCWLWHTYTYLLESVLDLANCCEGCFLHQGKNSSVIHHSCFPWSSGSFGVAELTGAFLLLRMFQTVVLATPNVFAISLMGLFCYQPNDGLLHW